VDGTHGRRIIGGLSFLRTLLITPFMTRTANGPFPPIATSTAAIFEYPVYVDSSRPECVE
jgi:hypothetical protein